MNALTQSTSNDDQVTGVADDWQAPDFYRELDLEKAKLVVKFGDLAHLFLCDFEKLVRSQKAGDVLSASFAQSSNEEAQAEVQGKISSMQWVLEMMNLAGVSADYALNSYPEDAAFVVVYRSTDSGQRRLFRTGGGSPGSALTYFFENYPQHYKGVSSIYLDIRSVKQAVPAII
ncbi:hypothetical protein K5D43_21195 [Pseudomonas cichorii]|nr:hypothetical protein [Pseudomonas cichorii]MBX8556996.1 hypothetical protein [Pseudomonas cichorii]